jgi:hypothetical protein
MPLAGARNRNSADISYQGEGGYYWSSSPYGSSDPTRARRLRFNSSTVVADDYIYRAFAHSVRCFNNVYVEPNNTWTVVAGSLGSAGIFYNATL